MIGFIKINILSPFLYNRQKISDLLEIAKFKIQNSKCEMQNAKCKM